MFAISKWRSRNFDCAQYHLVKEGLDERGTFINNAPHLAGRVALVTPLYSWFDVPYVYSGSSCSTTCWPARRESGTAA